ncbi:protein AKNAD1 [Pleurodeles waltl]
MHNNVFDEHAVTSEGHLTELDEDEYTRNNEDGHDFCPVGGVQSGTFDIPGNTSDEEQEELPYDGNLDSAFQHRISEWNSVGNSGNHLDFISLNSGLVKGNRDYEKKEEEHISEKYIATQNSYGTISETFISAGTTTTYPESTPCSEKNLSADVFPAGVNIRDFSNSRIPDVLLRHFYDDNELSSSLFIDSETIPETSFAESSDATIISKISNSKCYEHTREETEDLEKYLLESQGARVDSNYDEETMKLENNSIPDEADTSGIDLNNSIHESFTYEMDDDMFNHRDHYQTIEDRTKHGEYQFEKRASPQEFKYGQGQVHYPLPDFSKIAPKVKIPKKTANEKPVPAIRRASSSPNLTGKASIIRDVLETMPSFELNDRLKPEENSQETNVLQVFPSEHSFQTTFGIHPGAMSTYPTEGSGCSSGLEEEKLPLKPSGLQTQTEGEKMSHMLKEQTDQFKIKVFQHLKGCLETLERNYLSTKERHRSLQLQKQHPRSGSVGEFDPDRMVEGEIFRLGMLLEDVKEKIDGTTCNPSSSVPCVTTDVPSPSLVSSPSLIPASSPVSSSAPSLTPSLVASSPRSLAVSPTPINAGSLLPSPVPSLAPSLSPSPAPSIAPSASSSPTQLLASSEIVFSTHLSTNESRTATESLQERKMIDMPSNVTSDDLEKNIRSHIIPDQTEDLSSGSHQPVFADPQKRSPEDFGGNVREPKKHSTDNDGNDDIDQKNPTVDSELKLPKKARLEEKHPASIELDPLISPKLHGGRERLLTRGEPQDRDVDVDQNAIKGHLQSVELWDSPSTKSCTSSNSGHTTFRLNTMEDKRSFPAVLSHDSREFLDDWVQVSTRNMLENVQAAHKPQLLCKDEKDHQTSVHRNRKMSDVTLSSRSSNHRKFSIVIKEKEAPSDLTESDFSSAVGDAPYSYSRITAQKCKVREQRSTSEKQHTPKGQSQGDLFGYKDQKELRKFNDFVLSYTLSRNCTSSNDLKSGVIAHIPAYSHRKGIFSPDVKTSKLKSAFGYGISERSNFTIPKTYYSGIYDTIMLSPHHLSKGIYGSRSLFNIGQNNLENMNSLVLHSALDQAIQTAKSMKKTTERMVQTVSADLAKMQSRRSLNSSLLLRHGPS